MPGTVSTGTGTVSTVSTVPGTVSCAVTAAVHGYTVDVKGKEVTRTAAGEL